MNTKSASLLIRVGLLREMNDPWLDEVLSFLDGIPPRNQFAASLVRHLSNPRNDDLRVKLHRARVEGLEKVVSDAKIS